jgi:type VI secretion system secreted protein VgrG
VQVFQNQSKPALDRLLSLRVTIGADSLADQIVGRHRTPLGHDIAGISADIGAVNEHDADLGDRIGRLVGAQLTPVELGQLLSGRFAAEGQSPFVPPTLRSVPARPTRPQSGAADATNRLTTAADVATVPSPSQAPARLKFSTELQAHFESLRQRSARGGQNRPQGGTILSDTKGQLILQNSLSSTNAASFTPTLTVSSPGQHAVRGAYFTLPFSRSEGSYTGISLGGGSAAYLINSGHALIVSQSGPKQFAYVRTGMTPDAVDPQLVVKSHAESLSRHIDSGYSPPKASRLAAGETAERFALAYYEGSGGTLARR